MVALNPLFISTSDLEEYLVDKDTGLLLANGLIYFYRAAAPNILKPVYQISGTFPDYTYTALPNPMNLSAVGTTQNASGDNVDILYYPWNPDYDPTMTSAPELDLYYIVVMDQNGNVQFTRDPWPPSLTAADSPILQSDNFITNQISNPTFTNTFLNQGIPNVYTLAASPAIQQFALGPDWFFEISGVTGSAVTVQIFPVSGIQQIIGSPPYMLDVLVGPGVSTCNLVQRFYANSGLWTSTSVPGAQSLFLYGSFVAKNENSGSGGLAMYYRESTSSYTPVQILAATINGTFTRYSGVSVEIPSSTNTQNDIAAYVDIYISFNLNSRVEFSEIQVIPSAIVPTNLILPDFNSSNRNEAYQGDYYIPRAASKPIPSYLIGWDFPVNPYQFAAPGSITTTPAYLTDQTICQAATTPITWAQDSITNGLFFTTTDVSDAFCMVQYLSAGQVYDMLGTSLSVNVFGYQNGTGSPVTMRVYLFSAPSTSSIPTLPTLLGTLNTDGTFSPTATGWTQISRGGLPDPQVTLSQKLSNSDINNLTNDYGFSGFQITDSTQIGNSIEQFAIVVTFQYSGITEITINSVSVVPGDLPCRPSVKSIQETLLECQYYYESPTSAQLALQSTYVANNLLTGANNLIMATSPFNLNYAALKRVTPNFTITSFSYQVFLNGVGASSGAVTIGNWTISNNTAYSISYIPNAGLPTIYSQALAPVGGLGTPPPVSGCILFIYLADARLGIV